MLNTFVVILLFNQTADAMYTPESLVGGPELRLQELERARFPRTVPVILTGSQRL